nr:hypothetical protein [uncultured Draconibacterium sp.]
MTAKTITKSKKVDIASPQPQSNIEGYQEYVDARREKWLAYSKYCCSMEGADELGPVVLQKVITETFSMDNQEIEELYIQKCGQFTMLDLTIHRFIKFSSQDLIHPNDYIKKRYPMWLDHAEYHCNLQGIHDEANDVLNEVLVSLLNRGEAWLLQMCNTKAKYGKFPNSDPYMEMDIYVLRMIQLNIKSPTSPYQNKYKSSNDRLKINTDIDFTRLIVEDEIIDTNDDPAESLKRHKLIMWVFRSLDLTAFERKVFEHRFVMEELMRTWPGPEGKKQCYDAYNRVSDAIKIILYRQNHIQKQPVLKASNLTATGKWHRRLTELVDGFFQNRIIHPKKSKTNNNQGKLPTKQIA